MLESVKKLEQMGFQLFASLGTADFYSDSGVKVHIIVPLATVLCKDSVASIHLNFADVALVLVLKLSL